MKVKSNGRAFLYAIREAKTSFAVEIDLDSVEMLKATEPETYWQSPHYEGWPAILIRYDSKDPERVREIARRAVTILLVTHHAEEIIPEIERVILLRRGRIAFDGPKADVLTAPRLTEVFESAVTVDAGMPAGAA